MGFRFQWRFKVIPGLHANLSKGGVSVSIGPKGLKTTIGKRGVRTSLGIPGTGIRYETPWGGTGKPSNGVNSAIEHGKSAFAQHNPETGKAAMDSDKQRQAYRECEGQRGKLLLFRIIYILLSAIGLVLWVRMAQTRRFLLFCLR